MQHSQLDTHMKRIFPVLLAIIGFSLPPAQASDHQAVANPNSAERETLLALAHIDEALADALIASRPLANSIELQAVLAERLDEDTVAEVLIELFVPMNLNTATREEIMLVPGMSRRMAHEFEEYRPYTSLTQFRREIGKYVDDAEVARFEQYVTLELD